MLCNFYESGLLLAKKILAMEVGIVNEEASAHRSHWTFTKEATWKSNLLN